MRTNKICCKFTNTYWWSWENYYGYALFPPVLCHFLTSTAIRQIMVNWCNYWLLFMNLRQLGSIKQVCLDLSIFPEYYWFMMCGFWSGWVTMEISCETMSFDMTRGYFLPMTMTKTDILTGKGKWIGKILILLVNF